MTPEKQRVPWKKLSSLDREGTAPEQEQRDAGSTSWGWSMGDTERESMLMATREMMWFFIAMRYSSHAGNCCSDGWSSSKRMTSGTVTWSVPSTLLPGGKPSVLVTYDESTFNANDGKRQGWMKGNSLCARREKVAVPWCQCSLHRGEG